MQGVLVVVNGAHYFDGYRLDGHRDFKQWRKQYAAGVFDAPIQSVGQSNPNGLPSAEPEKGQTTVATTPFGHDLV